MEPAEEPGQISKDNFLEVPNVSDSVCEDEEVKATFKPGFSPQPSRRGSGSSEDTYLDTPTSASRRVSFADSLGFNLVSIKEFDCWELPSVSTDFGLSRDIFHTEEYILSPLFDLPSSKEELMEQLQVQKAMLESTEYLPGSTSVKGIIRVLNISFEKLVYVRMSLDAWQTHYDILAEYVPNSCDGKTDQFSFKISLVPPYQKDGSKVEFCIRYETSVGTFWSNNNGTNYVLVCQKKKKEPEPVKPLEEAPNRQIKGCLKVKSSKEESSLTSEENKLETFKFTDAYVPTIICSHEDKDDLGASHQNVEDINREHDGHNEKELDLMIHPPLIISRDEKNTFSTDSVNWTNKAEGSEKKQEYHEIHTGLFRRQLSPSLPEEISLKKDSYHSRNYSPGNEYGHPPSEEIMSHAGEMEQLLGDSSADELMQQNLCSQEVLDDNANPAHGSDKVQIACSSYDHLMTDGLNKNNETGVKKTGIKDHKYSRSDFYLEASTNLEESNASPKDDYTKGNDEEEENTCLGVNENQRKNFQSVFHNQERQMGHPEISIEGTKASNEDLTTLLSKDTTTTTWRARVDLSPSTKTKVNWRETGKGTTLEPIATHLGSPRNGNVLTGSYLLQAAREKSDPSNPEDQNMNTQYKKNWNVLESQPETRGIETNTAKQIKEQAECKDMWEKRDNKRSLKATPTEPLFTCQETECYELSSLADHGITEKAQAVTAYIIKTTLERTPESMSARGNTIIAKLPQETARSDRPIEVKETAFDPHEGRKDDSHYTLCHGDTAGVIHDNDFERESHLAVCDVHVEEMEKEATTSTCYPRKTHDKEKCGIGIVTSTDKSSEVITGNHKATSKLDLHLGVLPTDKAIFPENKDHELLEELSRRTDFDAVHPEFNSDASSTSQGSPQVYRCQSKNSEPTSGWLFAEDNAGTSTTLRSILTKSEYTCCPESETLGHAMSKPDDVSKTLEITESGNGRERPVGPILQQKEGKSMQKSQGPIILVSEPLENLEEAKSDIEGLIHFEQSQRYLDDTGSESPPSATLPPQEAQAQGRESLLSTYVNSKLPYFLLFLIFLATIYYYDLMVGLAFYLFSLYWLYWEGGRHKESVKKK
ncbi:protein phosphatase 1 regulatory subunit 3A isoform X2 [Cricetulus griseus]|uniref:Protein phosphatase 1 regulatory subunit 3A n=1 Tax=Cricetulus griseus TaxID=10029 RepID=A0A061IL53_CRIGR|nr:protein phosphatase 1 regulatory subunit 3A isoform X2 [Cricetulus griseus]XP_035317386.1 protein phosphatase 1 regulatory subunit 3A isoform X2 [Cricetulus griseus]ERE88426.1 protein phosphatase 1 regulatory subunit 3A [Cricetulus griseus]